MFFLYLSKKYLLVRTPYKSDSPKFHYTADETNLSDQQHCEGLDLSNYWWKFTLSWNLIYLLEVPENCDYGCEDLPEVLIFGSNINWNIFNLLTTNVPLIIEISQLTGFYMRGTLVVKGLINPMRKPAPRNLCLFPTLVDRSTLLFFFTKVFGSCGAELTSFG